MELVAKLRYMGRQYANGQAARGGGQQKHYLEEAADEIERLRDVIRLVITETGEDVDGNMPHEPREALLILRYAAKAALTPNAKVSGAGTASAGLPG